MDTISVSLVTYEGNQPVMFFIDRRDKLLNKQPIITILTDTDSRFS